MPSQLKEQTKDLDIDFGLYWVYCIDVINI